MEMFLMVATMSVLGVVVCAILFAAATRAELPRVEARPAEAVTAAAPRFFVDLNVDPATVRAQVPVEALMLQIERHVRLEQVAAESFQFTPTPEALHMTTMSPLVH
jgi:hypothetical protein